MTITLGEATHEVELDSKQLEAVNACCDVSNRVVAVTGAAGSGKTTTLRTVYDRLVAAGYRVELVAPTGKAAKRIREVTGIPAQTIHRLLEYTHPGEPDPKTGKPVSFSYPRRNRMEPLEVDVLLIDEFSMVTNDVNKAIFAALPHAGSVRVFGDANQLAPIEEHKEDRDQPSPFVRLLNNNKFHRIVLDVIHRQGADSGILLNLQNVLRGRMPTKNDQWSMQFTDQPVDALRDYALDGLDEDQYDFSGLDCQIITPQNTSWVGTVKLNAMLQMLFHDKLKPSVRIPRHEWNKDKKGSAPDNSIPMFVGDKVIITRNMHDLFLFNGETGRIIEITDEHELVIDFGDKEQVVPPLLMVQNRWGKTVEIDPRKDVDLAYAITTHKSQGSEYRRVVYMLNKSVAFMSNRRNMYTACSRAREHVHMITDQRTLTTALYKQG